MISKATHQATLEFRDERNWRQFHSPRNLATALTIEAAELLEHFRWNQSEADERAVVAADRESVTQEIADVAILLGYLVHELNIDLDQAISEKLKINAHRYPVVESYGNSRKYDQT